ncbi:MAG: hypothetical protein J0I21_00910, partial [Alphaproteobacteria bacterium]|nr:hypothetical protein [Alphaproteobacteria bacterium]
VQGGAGLAAVHARLVARSQRLGHRLTRHAALRVLAGRRDLGAADRTTRLPPRVQRVRLLSRVWVPGEVEAGAADHRPLGVAVSGLRLDGVPLALDDPRLAHGWHAPEAGWRWTAGDAWIATDGARTLAFDVAMTGRYWCRA